MDELTVEFEQFRRRAITQFLAHCGRSDRTPAADRPVSRHRLEHVDRRGLVFDALAEFAVAFSKFCGPSAQLVE